MCRIIKNVDFNGVTGRINFFGRNSRLSQVYIVERKWSVAGIPWYYTKYFIILHDLVYAFPIFVQYRELFRVVSRNPRYTSFLFLTVVQYGQEAHLG